MLLIPHGIVQSPAKLPTTHGNTIYKDLSSSAWGKYLYWSLLCSEYDALHTYRHAHTHNTV